jgi:glycosyl transferase family 25
MNIHRFFGDIHVFIINLKDSIDRRNHIQKEFSDYKNLHILDAVDGRDSTQFINEFKVQYTSKDNFSNPLIACILSHAKAIHTAYNMGLEYACIFEDDVHVELIEKCNFTLLDLLNNQGWEIIQLYYTTDLPTLIKNASDFYNRGIQLLPRSKTNYPGSCYCINRKGMQAFLENVVLVSGDMKTFVIKPTIVDPEQILFEHLKSFLVNRPFVYYYFETMTFPSYINGDFTTKKHCNNVQLNAKNMLLSMYK